MPVTTYIPQNGHEPVQTQFPISNPDVVEALQELRDITQRDWAIIETTREIPHPFPLCWFRKPKIVKLYRLMVGIAYAEFQIINFYKESTGLQCTFEQSTWDVPVEVAMAYMYGTMNAQPPK